VYRNRERMVKIFVWVIVITMVLSFAVTIIPSLGG